MTCRGFVLLRGQVHSILARLTNSRRNAPGNCLLRIETVRVPENREKRENEAKMPMKIRLKQVENGYNQHTMSLAKMNIC
jgi:hypothetical protein